MGIDSDPLILDRPHPSHLRSPYVSSLPFGQNLRLQHLESRRNPSGPFKSLGSRHAPTLPDDSDHLGGGYSIPGTHLL